jgi:hypothetical protein
MREYRNRGRRRQRPEVLLTPVRSVDVRRLPKLPKRPFSCVCHVPPLRFRTLDELVAHRGD